MTSQASDILSQLVEVLDSPIGQGPTSQSPATSMATTTKLRHYSKVRLHTPVGRNKVILNSKGKSIWRCKRCSTRESGGTTAISILKLPHDIDVSSVQEARTTSLMQANIEAAIKNARQTPDYKRCCLSSGAIGQLKPAVVE
ncbi:hypothetical protein V1525DRAFT_341102 [Lipomyces kononenkoae]|uniref:Uncharacterized protein n=1 Tax=Lipomyces kononenkoae TaxID=34357 RepID=A0ACC3T430_LIPKO